MIATRTWRAAFAAGVLSVATVAVSPAKAEEGQAAHIVAIARQAMGEMGLKAVIVRVVIDGKVIVTDALGESMTGVPATPDMHFRNGAVAFSYVATILFELSDEKLVDLDAPIAKWLPDLPHADKITPRMLLSMTSGYFDYVQDKGFQADFYAAPFRQWTPEELVNIGVSKPLMFEPGSNWGYSHTGLVIAGLLIEKITGKPLADVMAERIFVPLGLRDTDAPATAEIRAPVLHAFSSERREALGIAPSARFYEESTYWNPSWATAPGAVQNTNIYDMATTAIAVGTGSLLSQSPTRRWSAPASSDSAGPQPAARPAPR